MQTMKIVDGDIVFDDVLRPVTIEGKDKLQQTIEEILKIERQENGFGASLDNNKNNVNSSINLALDIFKQLQNKSTYKRTNTELYKSVNDLLVAIQGADTFFDLYVDSVDTNSESILITMGV